jgi:hypothetical protein
MIILPLSHDLVIAGVAVVVAAMIGIVGNC